MRFHFVALLAARTYASIRPNYLQKRHKNVKDDFEKNFQAFEDIRRKCKGKLGEINEDILKEIKNTVKAKLGSNPNTLGLERFVEQTKTVWSAEKEKRIPNEKYDKNKIWDRSAYDFTPEKNKAQSINNRITGWELTEKVRKYLDKIIHDNAQLDDDEKVVHAIFTPASFDRRDESHVMVLTDSGTVEIFMKPCWSCDGTGKNHGKECPTCEGYCARHDSSDCKDCDCGGTGYATGTAYCLECDGQGVITDPEEDRRRRRRLTEDRPIHRLLREIERASAQI